VISQCRQIDHLVEDDPLEPFEVLEVLSVDLLDSIKFTLSLIENTVNFAECPLPKYLQENEILHIDVTKLRLLFRNQILPSLVAGMLRQLLNGIISVIFLLLDGEFKFVQTELAAQETLCCLNSQEASVKGIHFD